MHTRVIINKQKYNLHSVDYVKVDGPRVLLQQGYGSKYVNCGTKKKAESIMYSMGPAMAQWVEHEGTMYNTDRICAAKKKCGGYHFLELYFAGSREEVLFENEASTLPSKEI